MKRKSLIAVVLVAVLALVATLVNRVASARETTSYRLAKVERGDLQSTVSATGTLSAVTTVSVGTQVSGQIAELLVDYNDTVKKGQLLARIDPTLAQQAVVDAQANLERVTAQLVQAQRDHRRNSELLESGLVARSTFETTDSSLDVAQASVKSARVALDRARQNLAYTNIHAPIDGVVVERNVDHGQTVAASLNAPQLFLIANDLSRMQILANVSESDIASIQEGQQVRFSVQALPGRKFDGLVRQVRLQSQTQENVVNYTVVVEVNNDKKQLLPGMTARVEFLVKTADDVLKVPNAALRFKPETTETSAAPAAPQQRTGAAASQRRTRDANAPRPTFGTLYTVDTKGEPKAIRVATGITDGTSTEVRGRELTEGLQVIAGTASSKAAAETANNPFGGAQQQQQRGPRGGF